MVNKKAIKERNFKVVIDCVNSTGGISVPELLVALGVTDVVELFTNPNGRFPHNPEPLPEHLGTIAHEVKHQKADVGLVVDPDVDRLAIVCENGDMFGEEYTLVSIADYVLKHTPGNVVSNLSSTQALRDVAVKHKVEHHQSAVGEVHVVSMMTVLPRWDVLETLMPPVALDSNSGMGLLTTIAIVLWSRVTGCVIRPSRGYYPVTALWYP